MRVMLTKRLAGAANLTLAVLCLVATAVPAAGGYRDLAFPLGDGKVMPYALYVPDDAPAGPRPLVLALHPGGERMPRYGSMFARGVVLPALLDANAIVVAPDCPTERWAEEGAEQAVMKLLESVMAEQAVDRARVLVIGFSMGGGGAWYFSARHPELFTGAVVIAATSGNQPLASLAQVPTYVIHSRADSVVPFAPAEANARTLEQMGKPVHFEALDGLPHFDMGGYVPALQKGIAWVTARWQKR